MRTLHATLEGMLRSAKILHPIQEEHVRYWVDNSLRGYESFVPNHSALDAVTNSARWMLHTEEPPFGCWVGMVTGTSVTIFTEGLASRLPLIPFNLVAQREIDRIVGALYLQYAGNGSSQHSLSWYARQAASGRGNVAERLVAALSVQHREYKRNGGGEI